MIADAEATGRQQLAADGVFSGGGIKGLAFAGALTATEEAGYSEWHELAGTSAGAITAMALAAGYDAKLLADTLDAFDFGLIADYGSRSTCSAPCEIWSSTSRSSKAMSSPTG